MVYPIATRERAPAGWSGLPPRMPAGRIAAGLEDLLGAFGLVYRVYLSRGLIAANGHLLHTVPQAVSPHSLVALQRGPWGIVGTASALGDPEGTGLPLDAVFPDELAELRRAGGGLVEFGLLAQERNLPSDRDALLEMLRTAFCFGVASGYTDLICGVAPHHVRFYELMFGFTARTEVRDYPGLNHAPVVLLHQSSERVRRSRRRFRALRDLPDEAFSPRRFRERFCPNAAEVRGSRIADYLAERAGRFERECIFRGRGNTLCRSRICA